MDSTKIPITKNVLDTSIHYICTNNLKKNHRMMEESIWKHDRSKRCTYRLVWQGRLLGINQRDIGRENRSDRQ